MREMDVNAGGECWRCAIGVIVTFVTLAGIVGTPCAGAQQAPSPAAINGRIWYEKYCTPCHATGGAPGEAVFVKSKQPIDLRTYVQRHGGKFPSGDWLMVVMAEPLQNPHTEVWERIRREDGGGTDSETVGRAKVRSIADYIVSIQAK